MALERERQRVEKYKEEFEKLKQEIKIIASTKPYLTSLDFLAEKICNSINNTLDYRVEIILNQPIQDAARNLSHLSHLLEYINYFLSSHFLNHDKVAREIYYLMDWFFERCEKEVNYMVGIDTAISMTDFVQVLRGYRCHEIYPEFFDELDRCPRFYIIFVTPDMRSWDKALNWCVLFHEASHIIVERENLVHSHYPGSTVWWHELLDQRRRGLPGAKEKLWAMELASDYLTTLITGTCFTWRMLRDHFELRMILDPTSHPPFNKRIDMAIELLGKMGFNKEASIFRKELKTSIGEIAIADERIDIATFNRISKEIKRKFPNYSKKKFEKSLKLSYKNFNVTKLKDEFRRKHSLILEPPALFTLVTFFKQIENDLEYQHLLADCVRLYSVSEQYRKIMS